MKISLLCDDISQLLSQMPANPNNTSMILEMLAQNHPQRFLLIDPKTHQQQTVGTLSIEQIHHIDNYGLQHVFLPWQDVGRLGAFLHLDIYHSLALVLKALWEQHYAVWQEWPKKNSDLKALLLNTHDIVQAQNSFNPDSEAIFSHFREYQAFGYDELDSYNQRSWDTLIQEMILNTLHIIPQTSNELNNFVQAKQQEMLILQTSTSTEQEKFWLYKCRWLAVQEELAEQLLFLENRRIESAQIQRRWLQIFGKEYLELQRQTMEWRLWQMRLHLLEADDSLDETQLEQTIIKKIEEEHQSFKQLQSQAKISSWMHFTNPLPSHVNWTEVAHQYQEYRRRCKDILLELWKTIHPDHIQNHAAYDKLTQAQRDYLSNLAKDILAIKMDEIETAIPHVRLEKLEEKLEIAKKILQHAGIDINVNLVIQGKTIPEQIEWLEKEIIKYQNDIENLQIQLASLSQNPDILDKQRILEQQDSHEEIRNKIIQKTQEYQMMTEHLQQQVATLLAQRKNH